MNNLNKLNDQLFSGILPLAACEIRKLDWHTAFCYGHLTKLCRSTPGGCIINIHIWRKPFAQTLNQAIHHNEIHPSVSAFLSRQLTYSFPQRMLILLFVLINNCPLFAAYLTVQIDSRRIISEDALAARNEIDAVIRAR